MKIGVLFRGPIRPNINNVLKNKSNFLSQLDRNNMEYETWLITWNTHLGNRVIDTVPTGEFNNILALDEPDMNFATNSWGIDKLETTGQSTNRIWRAMLSSRIGLQAMHLTGKYDWIVHARTDGDYDLDGHLDSWFKEDSIATKHTKPFINDMLNIGPAKLISEVYNYGTINDLGKIVKSVYCPEQILMVTSEMHGIKWHDAGYNKVWMDEERNMGDPMK